MLSSCRPVLVHIARAKRAIAKAMKTLFFAALAVVALQLCSAHVRLTFPPARLPDYDFLDNVRTGGPCGVPGMLCINTKATYTIHYSIMCELFAWFFFCTGS